MAWNRKAIYSILTTLILVITVLACVGVLFYLNNTMLFFKEKKNDDLRERYEFRSIREKMFYCYGNVIDTQAVVADLACMDLGDKGISIFKQEYGKCPVGPVKELNYRGSGRVEHYEIPIVGPQRTVCPAKLSIYETAVSVPVITNSSVAPMIGVRGSIFQVWASIYQTSPPSILKLDATDVKGVIAETLESGPITGTEHTFNLQSTGLLPGLYSADLSATKDSKYFDEQKDVLWFRVVDPGDKPIINHIEILPRQGTIFDNYRLTVNTTDYLPVTSVRVEIRKSGAPVAEITLEQMSNISYEELVTDFIHKGTWNPGQMPNEDSVYDLTIIATNSLGNSETASAGQIQIARASYSGLVLIITNNRMQASLGGLIDSYKQALNEDGYLGISISLDSSDVTECNPSLSPAAGPTISQADAESIVPQCITSLENTYRNMMVPGSYAYVLILGGHDQVRQFDGGFNGIRGHYYTDDYYADLNGDSRADRPIGRLPDGVPPGDDTVRIALETAIGLHEEHGWTSGGTHYAWTLDIPRGAGSPTNEHIECIVRAMGGASTCGADSSCYFAPPYSGGPTPPGWTEHSDMLYVCGHGDDPGAQDFRDHSPVYSRMGTSQTIGQRDLTDSIHFYNPCWGGRINNVDATGSAMMQTLRKGAAAVFGGTSPQSYDPTQMACPGLPMTRGLFAGSTYLTNLAYEINQNSPKSIGDAWLRHHNQITDKIQREQNSMYADPSIRVK